jgi:hypothetical protein
VEKYGTAGQATDDNAIRHRKDVICMPDNYVKFRDAQPECLIPIAVPGQRPSMLRYT